MRSPLLLTGLLCLATSLSAADSAAKDDVANATKKLAEAPNYSWKTTVETAGGGGGGGGGGRRGPTMGRTVKDGVTQLTMTRGDSTTEAFMKGSLGAIKTADGWKSIAESSEGEGGGGGQGNPARFMARTLQSFKMPVAEAQELAGKVKEWTKTGESLGGDLTAEGAKDLLSRGPRRAGADAPETSDAKGTVKFWVKDGVLAKYEVHVQGKVTFNGNDREVDRTTTVEIKDVGTTQVEVPEEAKKKLS